MGKIIFVTGTDTGVGKTLLTALLVTSARDQGCHALAAKPFSSGNRDDANILRHAQDCELSLNTLNPFHYSLPVAPLVGARQTGRAVSLPTVVGKLRTLAKRCELLIVEGAGGLFVPLGERFTVADLIIALKCEVNVAALNKLGTINHTMLTVLALRSAGISCVNVALMDTQTPDSSTRSNAQLITEFAQPDCLVTIPFLGETPTKLKELKTFAKKFQKPLAKLWQNDIVSTSFRGKHARK